MDQTTHSANPEQHPWFMFLRYRMKYIQFALRSGKSEEEIGSKIGMHPIQLKLLCATAAGYNAKEDSNLPSES